MRFHPVTFALILALGTIKALGAEDPKKADVPPEDVNSNKLTEPEVREGWKLLFDGKALTGLRGLKAADPLKSGWKIERNTLVLPKDVAHSGKVTGGDLIATIFYDDFEFRFDFALSASADAGVLYFARAVMGQKPSGHEYQIIDDVHHPDGLKGGDLKRTGALYGILPRKEDTFVRIDMNKEVWNHGRIVVQGRHVEHWLNDEKCLEYDLGPELIRAATAAKAKVPTGFGNKVKSPIVLLDQGHEVYFRNLKIRPLTPVAVAPQPPARVTPNPPPKPPSLSR
jgi:hypothetical protein